MYWSDPNQGNMQEEAAVKSSLIWFNPFELSHHATVTLCTELRCNLRASGGSGADSKEEGEGGTSGY